MVLREWKVQIDGREFSGIVPCTVFSLLRGNGLPEELYRGTNERQAEAYFYAEPVFSAEFTADAATLAKKHAELRFACLDTLCTVYLNGVFLGRADNFHRVWRFNAKGALREGKNRLEVRFSSALRYAEGRMEQLYVWGNSRENGTLPGISYVRKPYYTFGWDWCPPFPDAGILGEVRLDAYDLPRLRGVLAEQEHAGGKVTLTVTAEGEGDTETSLYAPDGTCIGSARGAKVRFTVDQPQLWWPNGYGAQPLYTLRTALYCGGVRADEKVQRVGLRTLALDTAEDGYGRAFAFVCNGVKLFAKGANIIPYDCLLWTDTAAREERLLRECAAANFNMLRVWGGGYYGSDRFYDLCDEAGIMVMQDFMFSCSDVPDEDAAFLENVKKEAAYQLRRLRGHPCVTVWCGGNERCGGHTFLFKVLLRGLVGDAVRDAVYLYNSPCSWSSVEWDADTGDYHGSCFERALVEGDFLHFRRYIEGHRRQFLSECTMLGPSRLRSLKKFIPEEKLWPPNGLYDLHFVKNPYSPIKDKSFVDFEYCMGESLFGKITGLNDFVKKGMLAQAELMKAEAEYARSNPRCAGFMNWMFNDNWGCGTWAVIDYSFEKKPAYYAQKRAYAPLVCAFCETEEGVFAYVRNDSPQGAEGTFTVRFERYGGGVLDERKEALALGAGETARFFADVPAEECFGCCRFDGGAGCENVYHPHFLPQKQWQTALSVQVGAGRRHAGGYRTAVTLTANAFARAVFLDTANNEGVVFGDNYFDLPKGHTRTVEVDSPAPLAREDLCIRTIADSWDD